MVLNSLRIVPYVYGEGAHLRTNILFIFQRSQHSGRQQKAYCLLEDGVLGRFSSLSVFFSLICLGFFYSFAFLPDVSASSRHASCCRLEKIATSLCHKKQLSSTPCVLHSNPMHQRQMTVTPIRIK